MKIRAHRGGYDESIKTMEVIPLDITHVKDYINKHQEYPDIGDATIEFRFAGHDNREGWEGPTYLVVVMGYGVVAMADNYLTAHQGDDLSFARLRSHKGTPEELYKAISDGYI